MLELKIHDTESRPTVFHVTQHKCASQWVAEILKWCAFRRVVLPLVESGHFTDPDARLVQGLVYPTLYITSDQFREVLNRSPQISDYRLFVIIRDLRDLLVSLYFSIRQSHSSGFVTVDKHRQALLNQDAESGLLLLMENILENSAERQRSWLQGDLGFEFKLYRYEDLVENDREMVKDILGYCEIDVESTQFDMVLENNSFEKLAGRKRGLEDLDHHYRKGVAGDWKNYFTPRVADAFKERFNDVLVSGGYEQDSSW